MSQSVGELFVSLGVKGADKTIQAFTSVRTGLSDMTSMSLEAKAGLLGAMYGLEQLTAKSNALGTNLTNTGQFLKMDTKVLQEYGFQAKRAGSSLEELEGNFKSIQSVFSNVNLSKGMPEWLGLIASTTKTALGPKDIQDFVDHPDKFFQLLQKYAQTEKNVGTRHTVLKSFGLSDDLITGMERNEFSQKHLDKAPVLSEGTLRALDSMRRSWGDINTQIDNSFAKINAKYGPALVKDIKEIIPSVTGLVSALLDLSHSMHIFQALGLVFKGWGEIFDSIKWVIQAATDAKKQKEVTEASHSIVNDLKNKANLVSDWFKETVLDPHIHYDLPEAQQDELKSKFPQFNSPGSNVNNINIQVTVPPGSDGKAIGRSIVGPLQKAVTGARGNLQSNGSIGL